MAVRKWTSVGRKNGPIIGRWTYDMRPVTGRWVGLSATQLRMRLFDIEAWVGMLTQEQRECAVELARAYHLRPFSGFSTNPVADKWYERLDSFLEWMRGQGFVHKHNANAVFGWELTLAGTELLTLLWKHDVCAPMRVKEALKSPTVMR